MADHYTALIYTMVLMSAADRDMTDQELRTIGEMVSYLPIFRDYDTNQLPEAAKECAQLLSKEDGLDEAFALIKGKLSPRLRETAYALACDVAAADGHASQEELRLLELIRDTLELDGLTAAAIERGARVRHRTL
ncbi:MAG: tellurite resistance TerB family protein [Alphaproteobacteria bacterium]